MQIVMENIDDFIAKCRLQAKKCNFWNAQETEEHLIEQIITRMRHSEMQNDLLVKGKGLTLQEALNICRIHEASLDYMKELTENQEGKSQGINAIRCSLCKWCGSTHSHQKVNYPNWSTTCSVCGQKNHWAKVCNNEKENTEWRRQQMSKQVPKI